MPQYSYRATDKNNNEVEGTIDAFSMDSARQSLLDMHLSPLEILEVTPPPLQVSSEISSNLESNSYEIKEQESTTEEYSSHLEKVEIPEPDIQAPAVDWAVVDEETLHTTVDTVNPFPADSPHNEKEEEVSSVYFPLADTLRLYAGWLLAWYALVYALGQFQSSRELPFRVPYVEGLLLSPLVLTFALAAFLFLLLTSLHKVTGGGFVRGFTFTALGALLFVLYRVNV